MIKLSKIKTNPNNPRFIKDDDFVKLCANIKSLPKMMALRPIVVDDNMIIQGGNIRFKALQQLGYKEIPDEWVKKASDFTPDELNHFIILDNVSFGNWDMDDLANNWDHEELEMWGVDVPEFNPSRSKKTVQFEIDDTNKWILSIKCDSQKECYNLFERFSKEGLDVKIET